MAIQQLQRIVIYADELANIEADEAVLAEIVFGVDTDADELYFSVDDGATWTLVSSGDEKAKVSANDTTAGFLNGKLVAGPGIAFTENNDGGNETLTMAATGATQYRQFLYVLDGMGDFTFLTDTDGNPLMALLDLE